MWKCSCDKDTNSTSPFSYEVRTPCNPSLRSTSSAPFSTEQLAFLKCCVCVWNSSFGHPFLRASANFAPIVSFLLKPAILSLGEGSHGMTKLRTSCQKKQRSIRGTDVPSVPLTAATRGCRSKSTMDIMERCASTGKARDRRSVFSTNTDELAKFRG
jgi:hypothetical protein